MQFSSAPLPQIQPFQPPNLAGIANAMQEQSLNAMRERALMGSEQELTNLRRVVADPNFDINAPGATNRILSAAPRSGAQTVQALMAAQNQRRLAEGASLENAVKLTQSFRDLLPTATAENYPAIRAAAVAAVPGWAPSWPETYDADAVRALMQKADDKLKEYGVNITATQGGTGFVASPTALPRGAAPLQGPTFYPAESIPAAPAPPGAPAPRAEAPSLGEPGRDMAAAMLRRSEGFRPEPYFDRTAFRTGYGSDQITTADGRVVPVTQGTRVTQEDAERDLARRVPEFERRAAAAVGEERFAALPPNVRAALISVAYNYGTLPGRIRNAVQSGDVDAIAAAVEGLAGDNQGINARRRSEEAAVIRGANAMAPDAAPANAMLAPPDATVVPRPLSPVEFPGLPRAASLSDADLFRRIRDVQQKEAEALMLADVQRQTAAARAAEAGQTSESQTRGRLTAEQERENRRKQEGRENIEKVLEDMKASYQRLEELRGIPSERRGAAANIPAYLGATPPGQELGKALATPSQSQRNALQASGRQLLTAIKAATGMSAQEMNSNVELQQLMAAISSPTQSIESVREILTRISRNYGSGRLEFGAPAETPAAAAPAPTAAAPRDGVPSQRRGAAAPAGRPTLEQFLERARPANPNASVEDLTAYYNRTYGGR